MILINPIQWWINRG